LNYQLLPPDQKSGPFSDDDEAVTRKLKEFAALGEMAGAVAHDFNNILTGILGNLELLQRRVAKAGVADFDDYMKGARNAARRGVDLTQRLLAVSGHLVLNPAPHDCAALIEEMRDLIRSSWKGKIELDIAPMPGLWPIMVDRHFFEEAILNLAANARDAMPMGGQLLVSARNVPAGSAQLGRLGLAPGNYVGIAMQDSGGGMSDAVAARAFVPFFSTKNAGAGAGLGLATVLGFTRQSGGTARIAAHQPGRTIVELFFPKA
jgi:signal transduction histidine kinase